MSQRRKLENLVRRRMARSLLAGAIIFGLSGAAARGQDFEQTIIAQLQSQGYGQIQVERTLLGRVRILALQNGVMREIVLNPRTGEVLRDVWLVGEGSSAPNMRSQSGSRPVGGGGAGTSAGGSGSGSGAGDSGSADDDDSDDSDGDDDADNDDNDDDNDDSNNDNSDSDGAD